MRRDQAVPQARAAELGELGVRVGADQCGQLRAVGDVHRVGPDVRVAKLGDRVLFLPQSGLEVELEGNDVLLLRERDIQAVQSPSSDGKEHPPGQYL